MGGKKGKGKWGGGWRGQKGGLGGGLIPHKGGPVVVYPFDDGMGEFFKEKKAPSSENTFCHQCIDNRGEINHYEQLQDFARTQYQYVHYKEYTYNSLLNFRKRKEKREKLGLSSMCAGEGAPSGLSGEGISASGREGAGSPGKKLSSEGAGLGEEGEDAEGEDGRGLGEEGDEDGLFDEEGDDNGDENGDDNAQRANPGGRSRKRVASADDNDFSVKWAELYEFGRGGRERGFVGDEFGGSFRSFGGGSAKGQCFGGKGSSFGKGSGGKGHKGSTVSSGSSSSDQNLRGRKRRRASAVEENQNFGGEMHNYTFSRTSTFNNSLSYHSSTFNNSSSENPLLINEFYEDMHSRGLLAPENFFPLELIAPGNHVVGQAERRKEKKKLKREKRQQNREMRRMISQQNSDLFGGGLDGGGEGGDVSPLPKTQQSSVLLQKLKQAEAEKKVISNYAFLSSGAFWNVHFQTVHFWLNHFWILFRLRIKTPIFQRDFGTFMSFF